MFLLLYVEFFFKNSSSCILHNKNDMWLKNILKRGQRASCFDRKNLIK